MKKLFLLIMALLLINCASDGHNDDPDRVIVHDDHDRNIVHDDPDPAGPDPDKDVKKDKKKVK